MSRHALGALGPVAAALVLSSLSAACNKEEDKKVLVDKVVDAAAAEAAPPGPKNLDLAKAALASAKAKHAKKEVVDSECAPLKSLQADFADSKDPEAVKTSREIDVFCDIDVKLEGAVATLKTDNGKLADALKKKDKTTEQMYAATVKDGCSSIREHLATLATKRLDGEAKVTTLKAEIEPICSPPAKKK
ncbi:MAG: hypothetical protein JST00_15050 [Deltaproteobacteria bacterium]|nr:hypothetical protein [Deltaproteobacteria bacterium]